MPSLCRRSCRRPNDVVAVNMFVISLCAPERFRLAKALVDLLVTIVPGRPSADSKNTLGGENRCELYWKASMPAMKVKSSVCRAELYTERFVLMLPMYRNTSSGFFTSCASWNGFAKLLTNGFGEYCPLVVAERFTQVGVAENTSPGETTGLLSLPEMPRSVSVWMNWLLDRRLMWLPINCPMLAVID